MEKYLYKLDPADEPFSSLTDEEWDDLCSDLDNTIHEFLDRLEIDA